jgi:hypothetical protein
MTRDEYVISHGKAHAQRRRRGRDLGDVRIRRHSRLTESILHSPMTGRDEDEDLTREKSSLLHGTIGFLT